MHLSNPRPFLSIFTQIILKIPSLMLSSHSAKDNKSVNTAALVTSKYNQNRLKFFVITIITVICADGVVFE